MIAKLWKEFEQSFASRGVRVFHKKPNFNAFFDQEEHVIRTSKGGIRVLCHLETVGNDILPVFIFHTTNVAHHEAFMENNGYVTLQHLAHAVRNEHERMMANVD